ncbi:hypothetical protein M501DRAFT_921052, partial [Patellaria atrata CBS 101060]
YTPLSAKERQIRLLRLHPSQRGTEDLECDLQAVPLDEEMLKYEALYHTSG